MRDFGCDQEPAVMRAVASGQWDQRLQAHAERCANCGGVIQFSSVLQELAAGPKPQLPPAGYVWWQSRLRQRRAAQRRVTTLVAITQTATVSVSIAGLAGWIIWRWSEVAEGIKGSLNSLVVWPSSSLVSNVLVLVYLIFALLGLNVLLTVRAIVTNSKRK